MTDGQVNPVTTTADAAGRTFTQEQVNAIVQERLAREGKQHADYDATKQRLAELEAEKAQREEAEKSERQKEIDPCFEPACLQQWLDDLFGRARIGG